MSNINTNALVYFHSGRSIECNISDVALKTYTERLFTNISNVTIVVYNTDTKKQEICSLSSIESISPGAIDHSLETNYAN